MAQILIADDEEQLRDIIKKFLELDGHEVREAGDGNKALKSQRQNPADLILIDLMMPNKEGIETIIELRRSYPDIKIIAMSGGGGANLEMARHLGADAILDKPFSGEDLINIVNSLLEN